MTNPDAPNAGNELANIDSAPAQGLATTTTWPSGGELQTIVQGPVDMEAVREFGAMGYYSRLQYLSVARTLDHESRQKSLPVLTSLVAFTLGSAAAAATGVAGLWGLVPVAVFVSLSAVAVNFFGKKDATKESTHAAWVKALEEVHSEKTKKNGLDD